MHLTKLRNVGGSVMFAIPKSILEGLALQPNTEVGLSVQDGKLIIEPRPRPRFTLAELMEQCDPAVPLTDEDQIWLASAPIGREAL